MTEQASYDFDIRVDLYLDCPLTEHQLDDCASHVAGLIRGPYAQWHGYPLRARRGTYYIYTITQYVAKFVTDFPARRVAENPI